VRALEQRKQDKRAPSTPATTANVSIIVVVVLVFVFVATSSS